MPAKRQERNGKNWMRANKHAGRLTNGSSIKICRLLWPNVTHCGSFSSIVSNNQFISSMSIVEGYSIHSDPNSFGRCVYQSHFPASTIVSVLTFWDVVRILRLRWRSDAIEYARRLSASFTSIQDETQNRIIRFGASAGAAARCNWVFTFTIYCCSKSTNEMDDGTIAGQRVSFLFHYYHFWLELLFFLLLNNNIW